LTAQQQQELQILKAKKKQRTKAKKSNAKEEHFAKVYLQFSYILFNVTSDVWCIFTTPLCLPKKNKLKNK